MRLINLATAVLLGSMANAQNLVPNPSFEARIGTQCPSTEGSVDGFVVAWTKATLGSSDYFNACTTNANGCFTDVPVNFAGSQAANTGNAYGGFIVYGTNPIHLADQREYLEVPLTAPLVVGRVYRIRFFVSLAEGSEWAIQEIGAYLSTTQVTAASAAPSGGGAGTGPIIFAPPLQYEHSGSFLANRTDWMELGGSFTAVGGEQWLVIGNFQFDSGTTAQAGAGSCFPPTCDGCNIDVAYYYLDDVSVELDLEGCEVLDDGSAETSRGTGNPADDFLWMHSQGQVGLTTFVDSISTAWGSAATPGSGPPNSTPARVGIWDDPNEDGNPDDAVLLCEQTVFVVGSGTDVLQTVQFSPKCEVTGKYFIGASCTGGTFPAPLDTTPPVPGPGKVWFVASTSGPIIYNNLGGEEIPPTDEDTVIPGAWLLRAECKTSNITPFCFGDGTGLPCPCVNVIGAPGNGCRNSVPGNTGAHLAGSGDAIIGPGDTVSITATGVRKGSPTLAFFFSGSVGVQQSVSDGLLCTGLPLCRLWKWAIPGPAGGVITLTGPDATTIPDTSIPPNDSISNRSTVKGCPCLNGETRLYTVWYRDPPNFACAFPSTSNYTNGLRVVWVGP